MPEKTKFFIDKRTKYNKQLILVGMSEKAREVLTTPDITPPVITITNPVDGSTISMLNNTITGSVEDESALDIVTLKLNDQLVASWRKKGDFSKAVNYTTDPWGKKTITNRITITATDGYGNSDTKEIRVNVLPS